MSPKSALGAEMDKRNAHLFALQGVQLKEDLEALKRAFYTFNTNAQDLANHVGQFILSAQNARDVSDDYMDELVRLLHNYLTSVTSLVEAQRVVMRHRWGDKSEFETKDYTEKLADAFETGEAVFMSKLRNYCTHYSIPLPEPTTTLFFEQGMPGPELRNTMQLDRDNLLRWDSWKAPAKEYLKQQSKQFDLAPIIERYVNAAGQFAAWFWAEVNGRSGAQIDEMISKGTELNLWYREQDTRPDWFIEGKPRPVGYSARVDRAERRRARYEHGTRGFRVWAVDIEGVIVLATDDDWTPLPR